MKLESVNPAGELIYQFEDDTTFGIFVSEKTIAFDILFSRTSGNRLPDKVLEEVRDFIFKGYNLPKKIITETDFVNLVTGIKTYIRDNNLLIDNKIKVLKKEGMKNIDKMKKLQMQKLGIYPVDYIGIIDCIVESYIEDFYLSFEKIKEQYNPLAYFDKETIQFDYLDGMILDIFNEYYKLQ